MWAAAAPKIWDMLVEDWDHTIKLNLRGIPCTRAVPHMIKRNAATICLSSGAREGTPWTAYYQGGCLFDLWLAARFCVTGAGIGGVQHPCQLPPGPIDTERLGPTSQIKRDGRFQPDRMTPLGGSANLSSRKCCCFCIR